MGPCMSLCVLRGPYEFLNNHMRPYGTSLVLICRYALLCIPMGPYGSLLVLMHSYRSLWVLMGSFACLWVFVGP